jgi:PAS domain S-box-containing protein
MKPQKETVPVKSPSTWWRRLVAGILYLIVFVFLDLLTRTWQIFPGVVAWYPPSGISFAFLLTFGAGFLPMIAIASLISNFLIYQIPGPPLAVIGWAFFTALVYGTALWILRQRLRVNLELARVRDVLWLTVISAAASLILAIGSISAATATGSIPAADWTRAVFHWWIGETIGLLVVAPALLLHVMPWLKRFVRGGADRPPARASFSWSKPKMLLQGASVLAALYVVFGIPALESFHPLYLLAIPLIWIALDYGLAGISFGILAINLGSTYMMWSQHFEPARLGELQLLLLVISVMGLILGAVRTERLQSNEDLRASEAHKAAILESALDCIISMDSRGRILEFNPAAEQTFGLSRAEALGGEMAELIIPMRFREQHRHGLKRYLATRDSQILGKRIELAGLRADGSEFPVELTITRIAGDEPPVFTGVLRDITEHKQAEAAQEESQTLFRALFELSPEAILLIDPHHPTISWPIIDCNVKALNMNGYLRDELLGRSIDIFNATPGTPEERATRLQHLREVGNFHGEGLHRHKDGTLFFIEYSSTLIKVGGRELIIGIDRDISERKLAEESLMQSQDRYRSLFEDSPIALWDEDFSAAKHRLDVLREQDGVTDFRAYLSSHPEIITECASLIKLIDVNKAALELYGVSSKEELIGNLSEVISPNMLTHFLDELVSIAAGRTHYSWEGKDLSRSGRSLEIRVSWSVAPGYEDDFSKVIVSVTDLTDLKRAEESLRRKLAHLAALTEIDRAITSTVGLEISLETVLAQVTSQLGVDAANVLLLDPVSFDLTFAAGRGFRTQAFERPQTLRLGEGYAGQAAMDRRIVHVSDLAARKDNPRLQKALPGESFVSYYGVPLISKGIVTGVLEIFHRARLEPDEEWFDFLNTLAGQAAIAIDNANLFDGLQHSNLELTLAYDATIEGWSHALDLRDKETEGHSLRVTEMTVQLARAFGLSEMELIHIRRGALLHDIGKMGVPDGILLKPGPLTDEEWVAMKKHPAYAHQMLSPISYLKPALDIPYAHHEKWDGTGYPRGLAGEQIPIAARIFAVVDVYDALTSDRPYRAAWSKEMAIEHIREASNAHFDPRVVEAFIRMMM